MPLRMSLPRPGEPSWPGENRTGRLFPDIDEPKRLPDGPDLPEAPCSGGALPVDQANPNSVVSDPTTHIAFSQEGDRLTSKRCPDGEDPSYAPSLPDGVRGLRNALGPRRAFRLWCLCEQSSPLARKDTVTGPVSPHSHDDVAVLECGHLPRTESRNGEDAEHGIHGPGDRGSPSARAARAWDDVEATLGRLSRAFQAHVRRRIRARGA